MINSTKIILKCVLKPRKFRSFIESAKFSSVSSIPPTRPRERKGNLSVIPKSIGLPTPPFLGSSDELVSYLTDKKRTIAELLSVDIRSFPAELRLTCLEAVLLSASSLLPNAPLYSRKVALPSPILFRSSANHQFDRFTEVTAISIGIDPSSVAAMGFLPINALKFPQETSDWLQDERFHLLLLSTVAGAKEISRPRLLVLAACLRQLLDHVSGKAVASVLRLITLQINEASPTELIYISSLLRGLPGMEPTDTRKDSDQTTVLSVEANLLREALQRHVMDRVLEFESLGVLPLLRLAYDFGPKLATGIEKQRLLGVIETVVATRPKEQNLFTTCLLFSAMQEMNTPRSGLVRRCLGQIRRKLHLASIYPLTDQSAWLSSALAALANLAVGGPIPKSFTPLQYSRLPIEGHFLPDTSLSATNTPNLTAFKPGVDVHNTFKIDWVRQLLFDVANYIVDGFEKNSSSSTNDGSNREPEGNINCIRASLALLELGIRHQMLIEACVKRLPTASSHLSGNNHDVKSEYLSFVNLHIDSPSEVLLTSRNFVEESMKDVESLVTSNSVKYLPRADWQLYYNLVNQHCQHGGGSIVFDENTRELFRAYLSLKIPYVGSFIAEFQSRVRPELELEIFPFSLVQLENGGKFFADIIIRKKSTVDPAISKYVLCFLCWSRDSLVHRPLDILESSYKRICPIPLLRLTYCDNLPQVDQNLARDRYLREIAVNLRDGPGVLSASTEIHPIRNFVNYSEPLD